MHSITLSFATLSELAAAVAKLTNETAAPATQKDAAAPAPKPAKTAVTQPSAATAQSAAPAPSPATVFEYKTLREAVLPHIPKMGADPFNAIAGEFGFPSLKALGEKGTPDQWEQAHAKVLALIAAQDAA